jgi:DNA-binding transcriptional LysR family regulator
VESGPATARRASCLDGQPGHAQAPGRPTLDLFLQLVSIATGAAPVLLVFYLLARNGERPSSIGVDATEPGRDLLRGAVPAGRGDLEAHTVNAQVHLLVPDIGGHWRHDKFVITLPPGHPLAVGSPGPVHLARFADEAWVWLRREASPDYHDQLMATCRKAGFSPDIRHLANSIFTQLTMTASGLGVTLVPNVTARQIQPSAPHRPLIDRADIVELCLVSRDGASEPLTEHFLRIATL